MFAMVTWCHAGTASAQWNQNPTKDIYFTFSEPVTIPNMTLPAGKYLFRHVGENTGRQTLQIFNGDRSKLQATIMTVAAVRRDAPEKPEIRLVESTANTPPVIGTWWYPGMRQGWEFVYPRAQATKLAKTAKEPILTTAKDIPPGDVNVNTDSANLAASDLARITPSGELVPYSESTPQAVTPMNGMAQRGELAVADENAAPGMARTPAGQAERAQSSSTSGTSRTRLPRTASETPLIGLVGILALAGAFGLFVSRRRAF